MKPPNFEALGQLEIVREYLEAFRSATGVPVRIAMGKARRATARGKLRALRVAVVIGGRRVATLLSAPVNLPEEKFRALERLLAIFARHLTDCAERYLTATGEREPPAVASAKGYVGQHLAEHITTRDAARHVHLSADYFGRSFKKATGLTLSEYIAHERVEKAKDLLADPQTRIADVAFHSGFESVPYFNRVFRKLTGMTPRSYRRSLSATPKKDKKKSSHA
jgi:AraC-like DNA-binding protein